MHEEFFFGYNRYYSNTQMLMELRLSSFETLRASSSIVFNNSLACSTNPIVCHLHNVDV